MFKAVLNPISSVLLFLLLCFYLNLEDFISILIIGFPYLLISSITSLILYFIFKNKAQHTVNKLFLLLLTLPFGTSILEQKLTFLPTQHEIEYSVIINCPQSFVFEHLKSVSALDISDLENNYFNTPLPVRSTYDSIRKIHKSFYKNGVVLHEYVDSLVQDKFIRFGTLFLSAEIRRCARPCTRLSSITAFSTAWTWAL